MPQPGPSFFYILTLMHYMLKAFESSATFTNSCCATKSNTFCWLTFCICKTKWLFAFNQLKRQESDSFVLKSCLIPWPARVNSVQASQHTTGSVVSVSRTTVVFEFIASQPQHMLMSSHPTARSSISMDFYSSLKTPQKQLWKLALNWSNISIWWK